MNLPLIQGNNLSYRSLRKYTFAGM